MHPLPRFWLINATLLAIFSTAHSSSMSRRDVSPSLLSEMELYSQYSAAIYCADNGQKPAGTAIACITGSCREVESTGAFIYGNFFNVGLFGTTGMLAIDPTNKKLVLAFRGAEGLGVLSQLAQDFIPCSAICEKCHYHDGYYGTWTIVRDQVVALVEEAQGKHPGYPLVVTGHSLGAIQAIFAAAEFRTNGTAAMLYNYGQPHVGDQAFADYVTAQGDNYRVTHTDDPAPRMQFPALGYRHISPEYWIYKDRDANFTVGTSQIKVINGTNSNAGNEVSTSRW